MTVAPTPVHGRGVPHRRYLLAAVLVSVLLVLAVALLVRFDVFGGSSVSSGEEGSGISATETRTVGSFDSVALAGSNNVTIRVGEKQAIVVHADDNLIDRVTTELEAGNLVISSTPGNFATESPMRVDVSVPSLSVLTLSGSGNIVLSGVEAKSLEVTLSGSGVLAGNGTASELVVTVSGSGNALLTRLVASHVRAIVSGSGAIFVTATKSLDASVPGSGAIVYGGNPQEVTKSISGSGAITGR
jgi:hypothetical protein